MSSKPSKCTGLFGRIFGHRFYQSHWAAERIFYVDYCTRCGMGADQ